MPAAEQAVQPAVENPTIKIATYNASLYGKSEGQIALKLQSRDWQQARKIASIVQTVRPDILLINEIDHDAKSADLLNKWFATPQSIGDGDVTKPIEYPFVYAAPTNTGVDSTIDLNGNNKIGEPNDCWGFGNYPGQYALAIYSRFPIERNQIRTFQKLRWSTLPDAKRPRYPDGHAFHSDRVWQQLRLSSKNHVDVPVKVGDRTVHVLASHPTPPVFDGAADRNGCRNHDEIRFWQLYIDGSDKLIDDAGNAGGLADGDSFVILGDLNSDPVAGDSQQQAIRGLLDHRRTIDPKPTSRGASEDNNGRADETASFGRNGQMRVDFVIPSVDLNVRDAGVFWPAKTEPESKLISASDHRLVWIEVEKP